MADTGTGIHEESMEDVFEVGFSTAEGGIGVGLSTAEQVAKAHGWTIRAADDATGGARFEITGVEPPE